MNTIKTLDDVEDFEKDFNKIEYKYQPYLTKKLDNLTEDFSQEIINEIVLWKVNRYALISNEGLNLLNQIKHTDVEINHNVTREVLKELLGSNGVRLAMASTILRFKNPNIYQIIDQRAYRIIYGKDLKYSLSNIDNQIEVYLNYLDLLKEKCNEYDIDFKLSDRILYALDKKEEFNKSLNIKQ
jgi:hypothetical protein